MYLFSEAVSKRDCPQYYDCIENAIDLGTMLKKARAGLYDTAVDDAGIADAHPIKNNAHCLAMWDGEILGEHYVAQYHHCFHVPF